jgi:hypothetical protein
VDRKKIDFGKNGLNKPFFILAAKKKRLILGV